MAIRDAATGCATADDGLVFDVGRHEGEDTDFSLRNGFGVVAFEAGLIGRCKRRFARAVAAGDLVIVEGVIAPVSAGGSITFHRSSLTVWGTGDGAWSRRNAEAGASSEAMTLPPVDREAFRRSGVLHYLKTDVEGVDTAVLEALDAYAAVFRRYRLFGRGAPLRRLLRARGLRILSRLLGRPLPGWYDTHARLGEP